MNGSAFRPTRSVGFDRLALDGFRDGVAVPVDRTIDLSSLQKACEMLVIGKMIDPAGIHDIPTEDELFERAGREPLIYS